MPNQIPPDENPKHTAEFVLAAERGDVEAFHQLYERIAPSLFAWASMRIMAPLRERCDPQDLVQEVWLRALRVLPNYDATRCSFRAWLFGVAKNVLLESVRRLQQQAPAQAGAGPSTRMFMLDGCPDPVSNITQRLARQDSIQHFLEHVDSLDYEDRQLIAYCGLEGLTCADAAKHLDLTPAAATKRWQRLRAQLAERGLGRDVVIDE